MNATLHVEHQILSICLTTPGATQQVASIIQKADTFSTDLNRRVYGVMLKLQADGYETDLVTVNNELQTQYGLLKGEPTGWIEFLTSLFPEADTFTGNLSKSCFWLIGEATRTALMKIYARALSDLQIPGSDPLLNMAGVQKQMDAINGRLSELSTTPFSESFREAVQIAEKGSLAGDPITGIRTGITELDLYLKGLHGSTMTILAARPATGKTAELCQIAYNIGCVDNIPVAIFSLEMKKLQLARRFLSIDTHIRNSEVLSGLDKHGSPIDIKLLFDSAGKLADRPLYVFDNIFDLDHIVAKATQLVLHHGVKVIFIDYIQLIETGDREDRTRVGRASRKLKNLANQLNVPVVPLAQVNRKVDDRKEKRPTMSDLKDSGSLEQDADNVVLLYCPSNYDAKDEDGYEVPKDLLYNIIAKNRNGSTHNDEEGIMLRYNKSTNRIKSWHSAL